MTVGISKKIAHVLLLSEDAVKQHICEYFESHKLKPENGGSFEKINEEQSKALFEHLNQRVYLYAKDIVTYVEANFGIKYSVPGMTVWLHAHGFSYKTSCDAR